MKKVEASSRLLEDLFGIIRREVAVGSSQRTIDATFPAYLPPSILTGDGEEWIVRASRAIHGFIEAEDEIRATARYEDYRDAASCCNVLSLELRKSRSFEEHWAGDCMEAIGAVSEELLLRNVELSFAARNHSLTFDFRFPVYASTVTKVHRKNVILLVEDENFVRLATKELLEAAGYQTYDAASAEEAWAFFENDHDQLGLVVSDITMPGQSGKELASRIHRSLPSLPVLLISGYAESLPGELGRNVFFLAKPYNSQMLLASIAKCVGRGREMRLLAPTRNSMSPGTIESR